MGPTTPETVATPSAMVAAMSTTSAAKMTRRRSTTSDSAPASNPNSSDGTVLAVCTRATMSADLVRVVISQAATVACMV